MLNLIRPSTTAKELSARTRSRQDMRESFDLLVYACRSITTATVLASLAGLTIYEALHGRWLPTELELTP